MIIKMGNYITPEEIDWPSGTTEEVKKAIIAEKEQIIEKVTNTHFYEKDLDLCMDGNGKNRIHPPVTESILSISSVKICGVTLPEDFYTYDEHSIYLDCGVSGAGVGDPELTYILTTTSLGDNLFPRGLNNICITGKYGQAVPEPIKKACKILIEEENDPGTYTKTLFKSEKIGKYSYDRGDIEETIPILSGVMEADVILKHYIDDGFDILSP